jgi:hypothetical protein
VASFGQGLASFGLFGPGLDSFGFNPNKNPCYFIY